MDSLVFRCPGCQQPFQVLAEQAGQMVRCPSCEDPVQVPAPATSTAPTDPTAQATPTANDAAQQPTAATAPTSSAGSTTEEVQPYSCPECEKPFGIYQSMFGSKMACPHCQKTVSLHKPAEQQRDEPPVVSQPKQSAENDLKDRRQRQQSKKNVSLESAEKVTPPPTKTKPQDSGKETVSSIDTVPEETPAANPEEIPSTPVKTTFVPQSVDHLLPPKFTAADPAFFYRRHRDESQVLLPGEDGSVNVVNNRIVHVEHNGQMYELISSPRYDRIQKSIVINLLAVVICGLVIAIVMTLLNQ